LARIAFSVLSVTCAAGGIACYFIAFFLTEPEERLAQDALERWWVVLDDVSGKTRVRVQSLARISSAGALRAINAVFGDKAISPIALWASTCLSLSVLLLAAAIRDATERDAPWDVNITVAAALAYAALLYFPSRRVSSKIVAIGCVMLALLTCFIAAIAMIYAATNHEALSLLIQLALGAPQLLYGILVYLFWAGFLRWAITRFRAFDDIGRVVLVAALATSALAATVTLPERIGAHLLMTALAHRSQILWRFPAGWALLAGSVLAITAAWPVAAYLVNVLLFIAQRVLWPVLPRLVYAAQRHRVVQNRAMLVKVGTGLLVASSAQPFVVIVRRLAALLP